MKTNIYKFYIGWNNQTQKREIKKAIDIFNMNKVMGFSVIKDLKGIWGGVCENSFGIEVISTKENPFEQEKGIMLKEQLERDLKQYLVLLTKQEIEVF